MRFYLGVHTFTPLPALYEEIDWIAVKSRHHLNTFRFCNRLMKLDNTSITSYVLQQDIYLSITNAHNWCSNFKQLLVRLSLYDEHL